MSTDDKFGYRGLEIYQAAHDLAVRVHAMTLKLPPFEAREEGAQIRRSSKSVPAQIVEGYGLRKYRDEFLHYLHRSLASADETREHLQLLWDTKSLKDDAEFKALSIGYESLAKRMGRFIMGVERDHSKPSYLVQPTKTQNLKSRI